MSKPDEYRSKAEYCREMAEKAANPLDRDAWLMIAADWLAMAQHEAADSFSGPHQGASKVQH